MYCFLGAISITSTNGYLRQACPDVFETELPSNCLQSSCKGYMEASRNLWTLQLGRFDPRKRRKRKHQPRKQWVRWKNAQEVPLINSVCFISFWWIKISFVVFSCAMSGPAQVEAGDQWAAQVHTGHRWTRGQKLHSTGVVAKSVWAWFIVYTVKTNVHYITHSWGFKSNVIPTICPWWVRQSSYPLKTCQMWTLRISIWNFKQRKLLPRWLWVT